MNHDSLFLILGGNSRLAQAFKRIYPQAITALSKAECNILDERSIERTLKKYSHPYIINCAAINDIEYCESHPQQCFNVNAIGPSIISRFCNKYQKKFIHISSDYAVNPMNVYGMSKYMSEKILTPDSLIIRTNFYDEKTYIVHQLLKKNSISSYENVTFNPISIYRLVKEIVHMKRKKGIINMFTDKKLTVHNFAVKFCKTFDLNPYLVSASSFKNHTNRAQRPLSSFIKPDIKVEIDEDLKEFKKYLNYEN